VKSPISTTTAETAADTGLTQQWCAVIDQRSHSMLGPASTWIGDRLGM